MAESHKDHQVASHVEVSVKRFSSVFVAGLCRSVGSEIGRLHQVFSYPSGAIYKEVEFHSRPAAGVGGRSRLLT